MCQSALPDDLLLLLLKDGAQRDAIKLYQEETGAEKAEARREVSELARRHGLATRRNGLATQRNGAYADLVLLAVVVASILLGALAP